MFFQNFSYFWHNKELDELYLSIGLRFLAVTMVNVFIPFYLLKLGYDLKYVFLFFSFLYLVHLLLIFPVVKLAEKVGFKHLIALSAPFLLLALFSLYILANYKNLLFLSSFFLGIKNALFFTGYHTHFAKNANKGLEGTQIGIMHILLKIIGVFGPVLGGVILSIWGFNVLFSLSSIIILFSIIPLLFSPDYTDKLYRHSLKDVFREQSLKNAITNMAIGLEPSLGIVWKIFIYLYILNNFVWLGSLFSLSFLLSLLSTAYAGRFSDKNSKIALKIGSIFSSLIWGIRYFVTSIWQVFIVDSVYSISQNFVAIPFTTRTYIKANHHINMVNFIIFREFFINLSKVIFFVLLAYFLTFKQAFIIGVIAPFIYMFF